MQKNIPATPRKAAAGIILSPGDDFEVLLAQRNTKLPFMGGHHVFPGGSMDREDSAGHVDHAADPEEAQAIFTVVREVFEETGLLCVPGPLPEIAAMRAARRALNQGDQIFAAILDAFNKRIDARDFTAAGLWVTPSFSPIRFHTRYFIYRHAGPRYEEVAEADGEIVGLDWLRPGDARRCWQAGELKLSTPIAFVLRHLEVLPFPDVIEWLHKTPGRDDHVPNRFEMRRGFHIIPVPVETLPPATHTNCVVAGEDELYVIDPGTSRETDQEYLLEHLRHIQALGKRTAAILLTHSHPDHTGAVERVRAAFDVPVWAHAAAAAQMPFRVDRLLEDGERIDIPGDPGWRLRCVHTPGHDPGHLCFYEESMRALIAGDLIANPGTIIISPDHGGDMSAYLESLERARDLDARFLIPAHGLPLWGDLVRQEFDKLIAHRLDREAKIRAAVEAGARSVMEVVARAYQDTATALWPLAAHSARAHLSRLGVSLPEMGAVNGAPLTTL